MWDRCSGECSLHSQSRFLPELVEGLDGECGHGKVQGEKPMNTHWQ